MRTHRMNGGLVAFAVAAGLGLAPMATAYYGGIGKDAEKGNACLIGYNVDPSDVTVDGKKQSVTCTDCDPSCDHDGVATANGECTFEIGVCINQSGVEGCTPPGALDKGSVKGKVKGVKGADGKVVIDVAQLLAGSACSDFLPVAVPEDPKGKKGATVTISGLVKKNKTEQTPKRSNKEKLTYICLPRPGGEACPAPTTTTTTTSTTTTTAPLCGNAVVDPGEQCDDGNADDSDLCTRSCTICGDTIVTAPEECDGGAKCVLGANNGLACTDDAFCGVGAFCRTQNVAGCDGNCTLPACGNGNVSGAETCDDGNTDDQDACPADCIVDTCAPNAGSDFTVSVNFAGSENVAGMTVFLDYPEGAVSIPGSGAGIPAGIITDLPGFAFGSSNDLDHALIQAVVDTAAYPSGLLFKVHFETCGAVPAPVAGDFSCVVRSAGAADLQPIAGVTCSVAIP